MHKKINVHWVGHPLDRPSDPRARSFMLEWSTRDFIRPADVANTDPVYRVSYNCSGSCCWEKGQQEDADLERNNSESTAEEVEPLQKRSTKRKKCLKNARLQVYELSLS